MWCRYNAVNFLPNPDKIHPIARPLGRGMMCNLWFDTDLYSASVNAVQDKISCYIWPHYNGTRLYFHCVSIKIKIKTPHYWNPPFPSQRSDNAESASMTWRHHVSHLFDPDGHLVEFFCLLWQLNIHFIDLGITPHFLCLRLGALFSKWKDCILGKKYKLNSNIIVLHNNTVIFSKIQPHTFMTW